MAGRLVRGRGVVATAALLERVMPSNDPDQAASPTPTPGPERSGGSGDPAATAAFRMTEAGNLRIAPGPPGETAGQAGRFAFLGPPRGAGDLGWLAHYRVKSLIGEGATGLVFLAEDANLSRLVALKVIKPELAFGPGVRSRFLREAQATAAIKHDHIVTIYEVGRDGDTLFLAMEHLRGVSLQAWIDRNLKPSTQFLLRIGREAALGLAAAHKQGLIHRDVKPANLWLEAPSGRVKLLDFGMARSERDQVQITHAGTIIGTPAYMSPEQACGATATAASDLFSLGCVLYRLAAGRLPFEGANILAVLSALAAGAPRPPIEVAPEIKPALNDLIMSLLAHDPAGRPASAQAVADAIRAIEREPAGEAGRLANLHALGLVEATTAEPLISPRTRSAARPEPGMMPRGWRIAAGVALAATVLLVAVVGGRSRRPAPEPTAQPAALVANPPAVEPTPPPAPEPAPVPAVALPDPAPGGAGAAVAGPQPPVPTIPPPGEVPPVPVVATAPVAVVPGDWGDPQDPDGDCKITLDRMRNEIRIEVPGRPHLLSAGLGRINAPRIFRTIQGDFDASVSLRIAPRPTGRSTVRNFDAPYHGAGILLWENERNYVRLEIAGELVQGRLRSYANFEHFDDGKLAVSRGLEIKDGSTRLRLERRGYKLNAAFSPDGIKWTALTPLTAVFPAKVSVGVTAINSASNRLVVDLRMFTLTPQPAPIEPNSKP